MIVKILSLLIALMFAMTPVGAQPRDTYPSGTVVTEYKKLPFRERHPKIYRQTKKVRVVCVFVKPIIEVAGATAQVVGLFVR
jgi:hypothetical protein